MITENSLIVNHKNDCRAIKIDSHSRNQPKIAPKSFYHIDGIHLMAGDKPIGHITAKIIGEAIHNGRLWYCLAVRCLRSGDKMLVSLPAKVFKHPTRLKVFLDSLSAVDVAASYRMSGHLQRAILAFSKGRGGAR